jgi:hypothetical protein
MLFISHNKSLEGLQDLIPADQRDKVIACSTAGEIGPEGYSEDSIVGLSFDNRCFQSEIFDFTWSDEFSPSVILDQKESILKSLERQRGKFKNSSSFALLICDGLSKKEELITHSIVRVLPYDVPLIGGSAGDGLKFEQTQIYSKGSMGSKKATIAIITTELPFAMFRYQNFSTTDKRLIITEADVDNRVVYEIDGKPAVQAYCEQVDCAPEELTPSIFQKNPLLVTVGKENFVRSIQKANLDDQSLSLFSAVQEGLILRLGKREPFLPGLQSQYQKIEDEIGPVDITLVFECVLRRLDFADLDQEGRDQIEDFYQQKKILGFNTYGEQGGAVHVNQTIVGIAFGYE